MLLLEKCEIVLTNPSVRVRTPMAISIIDVSHPFKKGSLERW